MKILTIILLSICIISCTPSKKEELTSLEKEVMLLHDEVMPKMGELRSTQKELLALADSAGTDSVAARKYHELARIIELANESMMDWMRSYDPNFEGNDEELKAYLETQRKKIEKVNLDMTSSLEEGRKALE